MSDVYWLPRSVSDHKHAESLARRAKRPFTSIYEHDLEGLIDGYLKRGRTETAMICQRALDDMRRNRGDGETSRPSNGEKDA